MDRVLHRCRLWCCSETMVGNLRAVSRMEKETAFLPACFELQDSELQFAWLCGPSQKSLFPNQARIFLANFLSTTCVMDTVLIFKSPLYAGSPVSVNAHLMKLFLSSPIWQTAPK